MSAIVTTTTSVQDSVAASGAQVQTAAWEPAAYLGTAIAVTFAALLVIRYIAQSALLALPESGATRQRMEALHLTVRGLTVPVWVVGAMFALVIADLVATIL